MVFWGEFPIGCQADDILAIACRICIVHTWPGPFTRAAVKQMGRRVDGSEPTKIANRIG